MWRYLIPIPVLLLIELLDLLQPQHALSVAACAVLVSTLAAKQFVDICPKSERSAIDMLQACQKAVGDGTAITMGRFSAVVLTHLTKTIADYAADLHGLLRAAHLPPPYILVGGSIGGLIVLMFGDLYPTEVQGIVMVDAAHPEQWTRMAAHVNAHLLAENSVVRAFYEEDIVAVIDPERNDEGMDLPASFTRLDQATLGDLPLIVLTAGKSGWEEGFPQAVAAAIDDEWLVMQHELAALSSQGVQRLVEDSGHCMHDERPDAVIAAVRELWAKPVV